MNLVSAEIEFDADEMEQLDGLDCHYRYVTGKWFEVPGGPYTAASIWDE
jgi:alcohol dehydrogenase (NADP+)